jgi:hypothetical protein
MPMSRRYTPEKPPGEICLFGMDYSFVLPPGVGISSGTVAIETNTVPPQYALDWTIAGAPSASAAVPAQVDGRALYAMLGGGTVGKDYLIHWVAYDTLGQVWPRTALVLVAQTS